MTRIAIEQQEPWKRSASMVGTSKAPAGAKAAETAMRADQFEMRGIGNRIVAGKSKSILFDPDVFLATGSRGRVMSKYQAGQIIFHQGDAADSVFYILRGEIKIVVTSEQGKEAVVAILGVADFFGEGCLIAQPVRLATAACMTDATVMRVKKPEMIRALQAKPAFAKAFTTHLLTRISRVEADLVDHLFNSSEKRLARTLLLLANFGNEGRHAPIVTKISQETLAEMVGTTRPRVSFFMNKFKKLGFIEYDDGLKVNSSLLSVVLRD